MSKSNELTAKQQDVVRKMRVYFGKKTTVTRPEMMVFMQKTLNQVFAPHFICRNKAKDSEGNVIRGRYVIPSVPAKPLSMTKDAIRKREAAAAKVDRKSVV